MITYLENDRASTELKQNGPKVSILISITEQYISLCTILEMLIQIVIIKNGDKF